MGQDAVGSVSLFVQVVSQTVLTPAPRFCQFTHIDPVENLKRIPIKVVHSFFHWVLRQRSDTLRAASSLQTYWNTFGLVRRKETGCCVIDAEIKRQWQGVSGLGLCRSDRENFGR